MKNFRLWIIILSSCFLVLACDDPVREKEMKAEAFRAISTQDLITAVGYEAQWRLEAQNNSMIFVDTNGAAKNFEKVKRFYGNGGMGISGVFEDEKIIIAITPAECLDENLSRIYPYTIEVIEGVEQFSGCGYTDSQPYLIRGGS